MRHHLRLIQARLGVNGLKEDGQDGTRLQVFAA